MRQSGEAQKDLKLTPPPPHAPPRIAIDGVGVGAVGAGGGGAAEPPVPEGAAPYCKGGRQGSREQNRAGHCPSVSSDLQPRHRPPPGTMAVKAASLSDVSVWAHSRRSINVLSE